MKHSVAVVGAFNIDSRKAHAINVCNIAKGFEKLSEVHQTFLFVRKKIGGSSSTLKPKAQVDGLEVVEYENLEDLESLLREKSISFGYIRDYLSPSIFEKLNIPFVAESHAHPSNNSHDFGVFVSSIEAKECLGLFTINEVLRNNFLDLGVSADKCFVVPDSVQYEAFDVGSTGGGLGVVYSGHLYPYKGIKTFLRASRFFPELQFTVIGGERKHILYWKLMRLLIGYKRNVQFKGWIRHNDIPITLRDAAVLVLPPEENHPSASWTSPVKLGEYLATGKPLVCSKIPGLERWVKSPLCEWFMPGNAFSLASSIHVAMLGHSKAKVSLRKQYAKTLDYSNKAQAALSLVMYGCMEKPWERYLDDLDA